MSTATVILPFFSWLFHDIRLLTYSGAAWTASPAIRVACFLTRSTTIASVDGAWACSLAISSASVVNVRPSGASGLKKADAWVMDLIARVSCGSSRSPLSRSTPMPVLSTSFTSALPAPECTE